MYFFTVRVKHLTKLSVAPYFKQALMFLNLVILRIILIRNKNSY